MGHQVSMWLDLPIMNWVFLDPQSHKAGHEQRQIIMKWKWSELTLKEQVSNWKKWPKCLWSSLLLHCILSSSLLLWSSGEFPVISGQRKRKLGPGWQWFCIICRHHQKVESCSTVALLWDIPEDSSERKALQEAVLQAACLIVHFGKRNGQKYYYILLTEGWPQKRRILLIKWTGLPILWISVSHFPQLFPLMPNENVKKVASQVVRDGGLNNMDFHWPWVFNLPEMNTESLVWHNSPGWLASYLVAGWLHWIISIMESTYWNTDLLKIQIFLSARSASAKITRILDLYHRPFFVSKFRNSRL